VATAAGVVVGALLATALAASGWHNREDEQPQVADPGVAARFLAAWTRSRSGTWAVDGRFERVTRAGRRLVADVHMAQRPPDRLVTGLGAVDGRRGDRRLACATDADGELRCREGAVVQPFAAEVAAEVALLRSYVEGVAAFYAVRQDGTCFVLRLSRQVLSPPYGERARFCFDRATGAPVRSEIERREARDRTIAVSVRQPTADDLDPEKWRAEQPN
jgi:hypothetical protein